VVLATPRGGGPLTAQLIFVPCKFF